MNTRWVRAGVRWGLNLSLASAVVFGVGLAVRSWSLCGVAGAVGVGSAATLWWLLVQIRAGK